MKNTKCSQCGLVNWADDETCKRCGWQLDWQYNPPPQFDSAAPEPDQLFSSSLTFLLAVLLLAIAAFLSHRVFHVIDLETAKTVAVITMLGGIGLYILAHLWLLLRIFEQSAVWGIATLFIPLAGLIAVSKFWEKTRRSFIGQLLCVGIVLVGSQIAPR
ncbi:MAG: hypothetical protein JOZ02_15945 [Acidobacteria bacterium]|nr:hypothetical protein [Acidobacteriota bacterium]